jgi:hypothetical protein
LTSISRTPPVEIRKNLRKEVNYGCPICRSPFLTWHHFDPPWNECHSHTEQGIIALCSNCHRQADGGAFTKKYLHELKEKTISSPPIGSLPWHINCALVRFGGNLFIAQSSKLFSIRVVKQEVFSLLLDTNGYLKLNASIWNNKNALVLRLEDNDIVSYMDNIGDLECSAEAKMLSVISRENDAQLVLKFARSDPDQTIPNSTQLLPKTLLENAPALKSHIDNELRSRSQVVIDPEGLVPTIDIEIDISGPRFTIGTSEKGIILDMTQLGYDRAVLTGKFFGEHALDINLGNKVSGYREIVHLGSE